MKRLLIVLAFAQILTADVEVTYDFIDAGGNVSGWFKYENRQTGDIWNNNILPIMAVGYTLGSKPETIVGRNPNCQTLENDADGLTQYRYLYPRGERNSVMPGEIETYGGGGGDVTLLFESLDSSSSPYPRYPHIVLKEEPWYGLKYSDTYEYAPPLTSDSIDITGEVIGQSDYYDPSAWKARDDAPLLVSEDQHSTQLWIGMPHVTKDMDIDDSRDSADAWHGGFKRDEGYPVGNIQYVRGSYIAPNSPTGDGVTYAHTKGDGPGGLMLSMSASWGQEMLGFDMRVPLAIGSKESWLCVFWDSSYTESGVNPEWGYAGHDNTYGGSECEHNPYQITTDNNIAQAYQSRPDYLDYEISMKEVYSGMQVPEESKTNIVIATTTFYMIMSTNFYGYLSTSRAHRLDDFVENSQDDFAELRLASYAYNQGKNRPEFDNMRFCGNRDEMLASKNLSNTHGILGGYVYSPRVIDLVRRIGTAPDVYDWGIGWGDIEDFCADIREFHFANDIPTDAKWTEMIADMKKAFDKMKGKAPTENMDADKISFRYNWLTMLRVMKSYLPNPGSRLPKGSNFFSQETLGTNYNPFLGAYSPRYHFSGEDIDYESEGPFPDTNWAPEIYWVEPTYELPTLEKGFPKVGDFMNHLKFEITADIIDDGVGTGVMTARYSVSPGDPADGGQSLWLDGNNTGGAPMAPVETDWIDMTPDGASQTPTGGKRFTAEFNPRGIVNEMRRVYIESNDNSGYRTISWVDAFFEDDGLPDLKIFADPLDGAYFVDDTIVKLTVKDEFDTDVPSAKIYYTINGDEPMTSSELYDGSIPLKGESGDEFVIKAIAIATGYTPGDGEWTYYSNATPAWVESDHPDSSTFGKHLTVTLTTNGDTIYFTTDGSVPTRDSRVYAEPFNVTDPMVTVKALAVGEALIDAEGEWTYFQAKLPKVIATPPGQTFTDQLSVKLSISDEWPNAIIYYTLDGLDPDSNSTEYEGENINIENTTTIKAIAYADNALTSEITTELYSLLGVIENGWYSDEDGDGAIDMVELLCSTSPGSLPTEITIINPFDESDSRVIDTGIDWKDGDPETEIVVATITSPFKYDHSTEFAADFYGEITTGNFVKDPFIIKDRVAPVIDKAVFKPGKIEDSETLTRFSDTLIVTFSELVTGIGAEEDTYFNLKNKVNTIYTFDLTQHDSKGSSVTFIIPNGGINNVEYPTSSDSIWIDVAFTIEDELGNVQSVAENRIAPLLVLPPPLNIIIKATSPFYPSTKKISSSDLTDINGESIKPLIADGGGLITVDFMSDINGKTDEVECLIKIFDPVGNLIANGTSDEPNSGNIKMGFTQAIYLDQDRTHLILYWNGLNNKGRTVGSSAYLAAISVSLGGETIAERLMLLVRSTQL